MEAANGKPELKTVEELLDATSNAPTYGLNARELILQAARLIAQEDDGKAGADNNGGAEQSKEALASVLRRGPELLRALSKEERPLVPFKAIQRSKVPRVVRQVVLERLTGQHLALALYQAGKAVSPADLADLGEKKRDALSAAVAQEEELYQRGKASKSVYLNFAAKCNAGLWGNAEDTLPDAKRRKLAADSDGLVEAEIDWDNLPAAAPSPDPPPAEAAPQPTTDAPPSKSEKPTPSSSIARRSIRLQPLVSPPPQASEDGLQEYSPGRHGGESPPPGSPASPPPRASQETAKAGQEGRVPAQPPPGHPTVAATLVQFLRAHLEPLYQAKVVSRRVYKAALQRTVEKVMASHTKDQDAKFLVREGAKVTRLLQMHIEREQAKESTR